MEIGFSLGSNMLDRLRLLQDAKYQLLLAPSTHLVAQSSLYETTPVGVKPVYREMKYLNAILVVETDWELEEWIDYSQSIEAKLGRVRTEDRNAPRPIDIDLIYADQQVVQTDKLELPHPRWADRRFVVQPLSEIRPDLILPNVSHSVIDLLRELPFDAGVTVIDTKW